jgi:mono/diheme cytochrome c family protein
MSSQVLRSILLFFACCALISCRATPPGPTETRLVHWAEHRWTVSGRSSRNPLPATAQNIDAGKRAFGYYCVVCHGRDGQNTGVPFATNMAPPVPSLASADVQSYSDGQLKSIMENGMSPSGMPGSKGILSDEELWQIVVYIRHLPPAGSLGEPKAYSGDEYDQGGSEHPAAEQH